MSIEEIRNVEHVDLPEENKISTPVDFDSESDILIYDSPIFEIKELIPILKKEAIQIEHVKLGRNSTSGKGLF
jgi:hypothetical protein